MTRERRQELEMAGRLCLPVEDLRELSRCKEREMAQKVQMPEVPPDVLKRLIADRTNPTKTFGPGDVVGPDPAYPQPQALDRRSTYRLAPNRPAITVRRQQTPVLRGYRIFDTGRVSKIETLITWPVVVYGPWTREMEQRARAAEAAHSDERIERRRENGKQVAFWDGLVPENGEFAAGDIVQSRDPKHLRRLWRLTRVELEGGVRLFGRRISWKTGEPNGSREQEIKVPVVRLVALGQERR